MSEIGIPTVLESVQIESSLINKEDGAGDDGFKVYTNPLCRQRLID